ncbi:MAG: tRNA (N(6)-L-threonylcarbamoyladenosine(37)-C(2))-methylthiotransferase MtaB, partial [Hyphomicrobium sp.]|jgi:threonylcarbamoyladenosine tRNA methylthiotransferase MtaB
VKARAAQLRAKGSAALSRFLDKQAGAEVEILIEQSGNGRTRQFAEVSLPVRITAGAMVRARVSGHDGQRLCGEVVA